jgi:hypothetical protein
MLTREKSDLPALRSVVRDFLVQTGDRTGTGGGGESFYGGVCFCTSLETRLTYLCLLRAL